MSETQSETTNTIEDSPDLKEKKKGNPITDDNNVIGSSGTNRKGGKKSSSLAATDNGALTSTKVASAPKKTAEEPKAKVKPDTTVAIYSERNVTWQDVGKISTGYNIVSKEASEKWLTRGYIRLATPEEVAREFGV